MSVSHHRVFQHLASAFDMALSKDSKDWYEHNGVGVGPTLRRAP